MSVTDSIKTSLAGDIDDHLLKTIGVAPDQAATIDLLLACAQVAREQLSQRWVHTQAAERTPYTRSPTQH